MEEILLTNQDSISCLLNIFFGSIGSSEEELFIDVLTIGGKNLQ
jgi:hypothetical protein